MLTSKQLDDALQLQSRSGALDTSIPVPRDSSNPVARIDTDEIVSEKSETATVSKK